MRSTPALPSHRPTFAGRPDSRFYSWPTVPERIRAEQIRVEQIRAPRIRAPRLRESLARETLMDGPPVGPSLRRATDVGSKFARSTSARSMFAQSTVARSMFVRAAVMIVVGSMMLFAPLRGSLGERSRWLAVGPSVATAADPPAGFRRLFNDQDLSGWHGMGHFDPYKLEALPAEEREKKLAADTEDAKKHWRVENGELINDGHGAYLTTDEVFGDFEFHIEYKTVALADSGIYLRATPQVQIWDYTKAGGKWDRGADLGSGGLFNNTRGAPGRDPLVRADKAFGEWNAFRIKIVGERVTVHLNDRLVVDRARLENFWQRDKALLRRGSIQLQTHGGEIRWRNLFLREIPAEEANAYLRDCRGDGYRDLFNGKDLDGWDGSVADYEVKDGTIVCRPGKGGVLFTKERFTDFAFQAEYRMPKAGNNGLAIRYPGEGRASYVGMCEIQLLDDEDPKYAKLDPRQYTGAVYGMAAPQRGYNRPLGDWNFIEVEVRGPKIVVELNGTRIVSSDVSQITSFMNDLPHPGKDLPGGAVGFAGHRDPVAFRSVRIKPLNAEPTPAEKPAPPAANTGAATGSPASGGPASGSPASGSPASGNPVSGK